MSQLRVYIAGPISKGVLMDNINQARSAFFTLLKAGLAPMCPHLTCFAGYSNMPEVLPEGTTHDDWMGVDLPWVACSDVFLRLPGESKGADLEEACARGNGIPVFHSVQSVVLHARERKETAVKSRDEAKAMECQDVSEMERKALEAFKAGQDVSEMERKVLEDFKAGLGFVKKESHIEADRRRAFLDSVTAVVCKDRQQTYGSADDNFRHIAGLASIVLQRKLKEDLEPIDVAIFMQCVKLARCITSPFHGDNWIDQAGYAVCGGVIAEKERNQKAG